MSTIAIALYKLLDLFIFIIFVRCIMTWIPGATNTKLYDILCTLTDPIESPIRSVVYKYLNSPIDPTPIIAFFLIQLAQKVIIRVFW